MRRLLVVLGVALPLGAMAAPGSNGATRRVVDLSSEWARATGIERSHPKGCRPLPEALPTCNSNGSETSIGEHPRVAQ